MSRHVKPSIRKVFGKIVTETPFSMDWVNAIKASIPQSGREWDDHQGVWRFDQRYYAAVYGIIAHFFGSAILDSTGGVVDSAQDTEWRARFDAWLAKKDAPKVEQVRVSEDPHDVFYLLQGAPSYVITAVYRVMAARSHPDRGGRAEDMVRINQAYAKLKARGYVDG
jgi:hypothetical protein